MIARGYATGADLRRLGLPSPLTEADVRRAALAVDTKQASPDLVREVAQRAAADLLAKAAKK